MSEIVALPGGRVSVWGSGTKRGVSAELERAYDANYVGLVRLARQLVDDTGTAEEVVQDVFVRLCRRDGSNSPNLAYLRAAVLNQARSVLRRRVLIRRHDPGRGIELDCRDIGDGVAEQDVLRRAIARLPRRQREVLVLRYYEDLPISEIASTLGITVNASSAALSRAMDSISTIVRSQR